MRNEERLLYHIKQKNKSPFSKKIKKIWIDPGNFQIGVEIKEKVCYNKLLCKYRISKGTV